MGAQTDRQMDGRKGVNLDKETDERKDIEQTNRETGGRIVGFTGRRMDGRKCINVDKETYERKDI